MADYGLGFYAPRLTLTVSTLATFLPNIIRSVDYGFGQFAPWTAYSVSSILRPPRLVQIPGLVEIADLGERGRARQQGRREIGLGEVGAGDIGVR